MATASYLVALGQPDGQEGSDTSVTIEGIIVWLKSAKVGSQRMSTEIGNGMMVGTEWDNPIFMDELCGGCNR
jgi:hypothetical protein